MKFICSVAVIKGAINFSVSKMLTLQNNNLLHDTRTDAESVLVQYIKAHIFLEIAKPEWVVLDIYTYMDAEMDVGNN